MDGVIHVFDGLLDLELLGVELVFELVDGGFELGDGLKKKLDLFFRKNYVPAELKSSTRAGPELKRPEGPQGSVVKEDADRAQTSPKASFNLKDSDLPFRRGQLAHRRP